MKAKAACAALLLVLAGPCWGLGLERVIEGREAEWEGRREAALVAYAKALEAGDLSDSQLAYVYSRMGAVRGYLGENARAIEDYSKALELDPKLGHAYSLRGYLRALDRQYGLAEQDHRAAIALAKDPVALAKDPRPELYLPWVLQHYADFWRRRGDYAKALDYCDQADRAGKLPAVAFRRAWIYFDMGQKDKAGAEFQKFLEELKGQDFRPFWPDERRAMSRLRALKRSEPR
jgi:tetratricopeptide (TPR) repeat protein